MSEWVGCTLISWRFGVCRSMNASSFLFEENECCVVYCADVIYSNSKLPALEFWNIFYWTTKQEGSLGVYLDSSWVVCSESFRKPSTGRSERLQWAGPSARLTAMKDAYSGEHIELEKGSRRGERKRKRKTRRCATHPPSRIISFPPSTHILRNLPIYSQHASSLHKGLHLDWHWSVYFGGESGSFPPSCSYVRPPVFAGVAVSGWTVTEWIP